MREAKVTVRAHNDAEVRDALDFDPINLPTVMIPTLGRLAATDYPPLARLVAVLAECDAELQVVEHTLVWSDTGEPVRAACVMCSAVGNVSDEFLDDGNTIICNDCV